MHPNRNSHEDLAEVSCHTLYLTANKEPKASRQSAFLAVSVLGMEKHIRLVLVVGIWQALALPDMRDMGTRSVPLVTEVGQTNYPPDAKW